MFNLKVFEGYWTLEELKEDYDNWIKDLTNFIEIKDIKLIRDNGKFYMTIFYCKGFARGGR